MPSFGKKKTADPDMAILDGAAGDGLTVEYRDATFSRPTRDALAGLRAIIEQSARLTAQLGADRVAALDDVIERWDANDATAIMLDDGSL